MPIFIPRPHPTEPYRGLTVDNQCPQQYCSSIQSSRYCAEAPGLSSALAPTSVVEEDQCKLPSTTVANLITRCYRPSELGDMSVVGFLASPRPCRNNAAAWGIDGATSPPGAPGARLRRHKRFALRLPD